MNFASIKCCTSTSSGMPSLSYMARKKNGSMIRIIPMEARLMFPVLLIKKKDGTPMSAAIEKQMSCLFVRLKKTFDFTRVRSLGTEIYADK